MGAKLIKSSPLKADQSERRMGCSASQPDDYMYEPSQPPESRTSKLSFSDNYFTGRQKQLLRQTWTSLDKDPVDIGISIFLKIFEAKADTKHLFPFGALNGQQLLANPLFRSHALRFIHAIGGVVKNLDALDLSCGPILIRLGKKHAWITDFVNQYLDVFKQCTSQVFQAELGPTKCNREVLEAWGAVFSFIAVKMNEGYEEALREKKWQNESVCEETPPADMLNTTTPKNGTSKSSERALNEDRVETYDNVSENSQDHINSSGGQPTNVETVNKKDDLTEVSQTVDTGDINYSVNSLGSEHLDSLDQSRCLGRAVQSNDNMISTLDSDTCGLTDEGKGKEGETHTTIKTSESEKAQYTGAGTDNEQFLGSTTPLFGKQAVFSIQGQSSPDSCPLSETTRQVASGLSYNQDNNEVLTNDPGLGNQDFDCFKTNANTVLLKDSSEIKEDDLVTENTETIPTIVQQSNVTSSLRDSNLINCQRDTVVALNQVSLPCKEQENPSEGIQNGSAAHLDN